MEQNIKDIEIYNNWVSNNDNQWINLTFNAQVELEKLHHHHFGVHLITKDEVEVNLFIVNLDKVKDFTWIKNDGTIELSQQVEGVYQKHEINKLIENANFRDVQGIRRLIERFSFEEMKANVLKLMNSDYDNFIKSIVSIEKSTTDLDVLSKVYNKYIDGDFDLISDEFDNIIAGFEIQKEQDKDHDVVTDRVDIDDSKVSVISDIDKREEIEGRKTSILEKLKKIGKNPQRQ